MSSFDPATQIPDLKEKVCLVTGGNSGLGEAVVMALARHNPCKLYLAARSQARAEECLVRVRATSEAAKNANIEILSLDLASFDSIKAAAAKVNAEVDRLDILQLNGGVAAVEPALTKDGYEIHHGTNYLGHVLLTQLLMPKLLETTKKPGADVRIVTMSTIGHKIFAPKPDIHYDELHTDMRHRDGMENYGSANLAKTLFALNLAKKYPSIITTSLHPGTVRSNIWNGAKSLGFVKTWLFWKPLVALTGVTNAEGAKTQLWCAFAPRDQILNGAYYEPVGRRADGPQTRNEEMADRLWEWTEKELAKAGAPGWAL